MPHLNLRMLKELERINSFIAATKVLISERVWNFTLELRAGRILGMKVEILIGIWGNLA
jgi:hypothetical protein